MRQLQVVVASFFLWLIVFCLGATCFADDKPEDAVNLRIDEGIRLLENRNYEEFVRDFLHPGLVVEYQKAGYLNDSPESRARMGRYWLKVLRLVQGEKIHIDDAGLKASVHYGRVSWSIDVGLVRKDDAWLLEGVGELRMSVGFTGPNGDPRRFADMDRRTKLHHEAMAGNLAEVKWCVHHEWDMFAKDKDSNTPLMLAETAGHKEVAAFLKRRMEKKALE